MTPDQTAAWLHQSIGERRVLSDPPGGYGETLADAYAIQAELIERMSVDDGPVAGWKVALTTPVMQQMCGVDHPCEGAVLRDRVLSSPATCDTSRLGRLGVEAEIALVLGRDLPPGDTPHTFDSVAPAIAEARAAIELVDDRNADYSAITAASLVANNSLNAGIVVGPAADDARVLDLGQARGAMLIDGEVVAEGSGSDILGHPLNAVAWLANSLNARGLRLRAGDVVMCGSFVRTQFPVPGQTVTCRVEGLGEASVVVS
jgi:2-keto-4-pentenoate hydratase